MKLNDAKVCVECEEIFFEGDECPRCNNKTWKYVNQWLQNCHLVIGGLIIQLNKAQRALVLIWKQTGGRA